MRILPVVFNDFIGFVFPGLIPNSAAGGEIPRQLRSVRGGFSGTQSHSSAIS